MRRLKTLLLICAAVSLVLGASPVNLWAQANLPNNPNAQTVQGPDPSGMLGYPIATVPATGALPWPVAIMSFAASVCVTQCTSPWVISGTVTSNQGTNPWVVSGTVTTNQGTSPWITGFGGVSQPVSPPSDFVDPGNSTSTPLLAGATFTGAWLDMAAYHGLEIFTNTDHDCASLSLDWSNDAATVIYNEPLVSPFGGFNGAGPRRAMFNRATRKERYVRLVYVNGPLNLTQLQVTTLVTMFWLPPLANQVAADTPGKQVPGSGQMIYDSSSQTWFRAKTSTGGTTQGFQGIFPILLSANDGTRQQPGGLVEQSGAVYTLSTVSGLISGNGGSTNPNLSYARTPYIFKSVTATAAGNTVAWTPVAGTKFRLMRYQIIVTDNATQAAPGTLTISLNDSGTALNQVHPVFVPAIGLLNSGSLYTSGWIDLGNGELSAAANNVLNINLSAALTAGQVQINECGTEE